MEVRKIVKGYLKDLTITPTHVGYHYIITAMEIISENPFILATAITTQLYPIVASKYNVGAASIARSIKNAIVASHENTTTKVVTDYFGGLSYQYMEGNIPIREFLGCLLARLEGEEA